jgi:hypothetical protein
MAEEKHKLEEEIERLARETGRLIREAPPEIQEELREAASAVMREEAREGPSSSAEPTEVEERRSMNPLAAGLGLLVVGAGFAFIIPPVGIALVVAGVVAVVWGAVISLVRQ